MLVEIQIRCPHCGEIITAMADTSQGDYSTIEDCEVCCAPMTIEGELIAKSTGTISEFTLDDRVFHQKFGNGNVTAVDGNKLTIRFDHAGEKRVVDSFVEKG